MTIVLLIAGIGFLLIGLLTVGVGVELDLSFGNTLILAGAVVACTGMILLGFWTVVRELKNIAQRLGPGVAATSRTAAVLPSAAASATPNDDPDPANADEAEPTAPFVRPPWHEETTARFRGRNEAPQVPPAETAPATGRRNLLFSSTSRKERERAEAQKNDPAAADQAPAAASSSSKSGEALPATFEDAWPQPERARDLDALPLRRGGRMPSTFVETGGDASATDRHSSPVQNEDQPGVTVLKSGIVDGMAYSLYSDGSIEAQMPEGMMRFASIDELRAHLDQRP